MRVCGACVTSVLCAIVVVPVVVDVVVVVVVTKLSLDGVNCGF